MTTAQEFARAAAALVGVPFRPGGRTREGLDCVGLVFCAAAQVGITIPDRVKQYNAYQMDPARTMAECRAHLIQVGRDDCGEGRIGLMRLPLDPAIAGGGRHFCVMLHNRQLVHCTNLRQRSGVVAGYAGMLAGRLLAVFRVPGIDYGAPWLNS